MERLSGKIALITGAAGGIGAAAAHHFVQEGAKVLIMDIDGKAVADLAEKLGPNCLSIRGDHCLQADNEAAVAAIADAWGRLDILYNNAGIEHRSPLEEIEQSSIDRLLQVNISGPMLMTQAALPALRAAARDGQPSIVFTASIQSIMVRPQMTLYAASKHGVAGFLSSLALELAPQNIRVNGVCPGPVKTPMLSRSVKDAAKGAGMDPEIAMQSVREAIPLNTLAEAIDIARAAAFLCSDDARMITGVLLPVDGGITAR